MFNKSIFNGIIPAHWYSVAIFFKALFISAPLLACQTEDDRIKTTTIENSDYAVKLGQTGQNISEHLMGFNMVYAQEKDEYWQNGSLAQSLKDLKTSVLRYPGGTVVTFFHWTTPTGNGWMDKWDPEITTPDKSPSEFMDVDEYMRIARQVGAMPLMGINLSSGWRFNRMEEGLQEALALMKYCKEKNFQVKYWYLDNEPYQPDANGGRKTPEQYGQLINYYAEKMKAYDPNIKIVANWNAGFVNKRSDYEKLIATAGKNIDMIDIHWYWSWGNPTWEKWTEGPMRFWTGPTYIEEIKTFRKMVAELGYPNIEIGSFEWNVGPSKSGSLSPAQCALMQTEMLMQFMSGGLDMAVMWPLHWSSQFQARGLYDVRQKKLNPNQHIFQFLGDFQGSALLDFQIERQDSAVHMVAALSPDKNSLRAIFLNKGDNSKIISVTSKLFDEMKITEAKTFVLGQQKTDYIVGPVEVDRFKKESRIGFEAKPYSVTMIVFTKSNVGAAKASIP